MRLSTKSRYGTRMLVDIAEHCHAGPVSVAEIASRTGISEKYMEKLVRRLKRAGLVLSRRGPRGGHVLAKPAGAITVGDVVRALEDCVVLKDCGRGKDSCAACARQTACPSRDLWEQASAGMFQMLDSCTLQSLLAPGQGSENTMRRALDASPPPQTSACAAPAPSGPLPDAAAGQDIPDPLFVLEAESLRILDCNQSVRQVYGFEQFELLGKSILDLFREEDRAKYRRKLPRQELHDRVVHVAKDGSRLFVEVRVSPSELSGRKVLLVTSTDMTRRMEAEQQLIQASKMATLGEMVTGMAHELSQPLSVIKTAASFIRGKVARGEELPGDTLGALAAEIDGHVDRASRLINHLREFGRKPEMRLEPVDAGAVLGRALDIFSQQFRLRGIEVAQDIEVSLPLVLADAGRLEQVFINLLLNARDAIEEKGAAAEKPAGAKRITLSASKSGPYVSIVIADTGCGIPAGVLKKIFEPFFTTKKAGKGTGLGLSISYGIIKDCGGDIRAESTPGEGARFVITLPVAASSQGEA